MNTTKQKQTHRYREQTSGYQWGKGQGDEQDRARGLRDINNQVENKIQGCNAQHRVYSLYFIINIKEL